MIRLDLDELDVHEFAHLLDQAEQAQCGNRFGEATDLFERALALWRGSPYAGLEGCQVLAPEIERLTKLRTQAVEGRAQVYLALGEYTKLIPELAGLVESDPRHEGLVALYMRALYAAGRQADAQELFWRTKRHLAEELGVDPTPELRELYDAVVCGTLESPPLQPKLPDPQTRLAGATVPMQLPADVYGFAGREVELGRLDALLDAVDNDQPTAVVISAMSGTAGVGKTSLAIHWAHRVAARFPDGQLYVNLRGFDPSGSVVEPAEAVRGFLDAFDVPPRRIPADLDAQAALYRSLLSSQRVLVVLDNARDSDQLRPLLPGSAGCLVVATSRNTLAGLATKEGARPLTLDLLADAEARHLLEQRVGAERVQAEPEAADDIVATCAGLSLALAIVAARAAMHPRFSLRALADELRCTRLNALSGGAPDTDLRTVFSWSYGQLAVEAQLLFRLLGLHPGPDISAAAAAAASLAGAPPAETRVLLAELTDSHLITEHQPGRYTSHDLLRTYAAELAHTHDPGKARHDATVRMLDHYLHTAHVADQLFQLRSPVSLGMPAQRVTPEPLTDQAHAMAWFSAERPVLLSAVDIAAGSREDARTWQLAWAVTPFLMRQGHWHDEVAVRRAALIAARRLGDQPSQEYAHRHLAAVNTRLGHLSDARWHLRQALELSGRLGDRTSQAHAYNALASLFEREGNFAKALDHARRALDLFLRSAHREGIAYGHNVVGWYLAKLGDYEQALTWCEQGLAMYQQLGEHGGEASAWDSVGYVHHHLGHYGTAVDCYRRALDLFRDAGDRGAAAATLDNLGDTHRVTGDVGPARQSWQRALVILDDIGHPDADKVRAKLNDLDDR